MQIEGARLVEIDATYDGGGIENGQDVWMLWMTVPRRGLGWLRHVPGLRRWSTRTVVVEPGDSLVEGASLTVSRDGTLSV
jgi:hypothetical protein